MPLAGDGGLNCRHISTNYRGAFIRKKVVRDSQKRLLKKAEKALDSAIGECKIRVLARGALKPLKSAKFFKN